jgi:hypothetical protein
MQPGEVWLGSLPFAHHLFVDSLIRMHMHGEGTLLVKRWMIHVPS